MGALLAISLVLVPIVLLAFTNNGILYWAHFSISYIYLTLRNRFVKKRFDLYDYHAEGQPEKNGFFVAKEEWEIEPPRPSSNLTKYSDNAFVFGSNSKSEYLAVNISKLPNNHVQASLMLQVNDKVYCLPEEHKIQRATSEENTFGSSRLKIQCLIPMRKWRIFYNGLLEEREQSDQESENKAVKHVKLSLIWTASSDVFNFCDNQSKYEISHAIAKSALMDWPINLYKRLCKIFDTYEQPGMFLGTVKVENEPEKEIYLWGCRQRFIGKNQKFRQGNCIEMYANFKNGSLLHLGVLNGCEIVKKIHYGYVMKPNGFLFPLDKVEGSVEDMGSRKQLRIYSGGDWYNIKLGVIGESIKFEKEFIDEASIKTSELTMNNVNGKGIILKGSYGEFDEMEKLIKRNKALSIVPDEKQPIVLCISFKHRQCRKSELCGGKGSSLGQLYSMSLTESTRTNMAFSVPRGIVVTTDAYQEFIQGEVSDTLEQFQNKIWTKDGDIETNCKKMIELVEKAVLPERVSKAIMAEMISEFGENISEYKFAVRSSATGEDTEQMSAAGQMETFLGVKGIDEILTAVKKCWASQFSFQAVEYKRGYGQIINSPMAVVIQEMVACDVAGVIFTCDPVTGNPSFINITANFGLGESVVSASADPDTVTLKRNIDGSLEEYSVHIGNKKIKIVMDGQSGTREIEIDKGESSRCCIDNEIALKLGRIAHEVEKRYGTPRDIEWGITSGNIVLFQSRPVTSIDQETDFETKHMFDTYNRSEREFNTKANVGEVMPGATSPLGIDVMHKMFEHCDPRRMINFSEGAYPKKPYFQKGLITAYNHIFITLIGGFLRFEEGREDETNAFIIGLFGRLIDVKHMKKGSEGRMQKRPSGFKMIFAILYMFWMMFFSGLFSRMEKRRLSKKRIDCRGMTSRNALFKIGQNGETAADGMLAHMNCTFSSSFWNMAMLKILSKAKGGWDNDVYSDFAYLLSTCNEVESANIPASVQDLGNSVSKEIKKEEFDNMSDQEIINWLSTTKSEAGRKFDAFIERHGHRCLKEFDVYTNTWKTNPMPVLRMLKNFINSPTELSTKIIPSFDEIASKLHVNLEPRTKFRLGKWLLPNARRGVREREFSKSLSILTIDMVRKPLHTLSEIMVEEGRLPRKELMFFLCIDEIQQLIRTRSPRLIAKAIRRERVHDSLDRLVFPEICEGIIKPVEDTEIQASGKGFKMTGVPVSQGVVTAKARVVMTLEEAKSIEKGDILITYSTDIGWSPYFPLLAGVVTELGGLISHGAVVAREYGLPCVVSLHGATRAFKSGDIVILDGGNGTLQKVDVD